MIFYEGERSWAIALARKKKTMLGTRTVWSARGYVPKWNRLITLEQLIKVKTGKRQKKQGPRVQLQAKDWTLSKSLVR